jgi:hypothetical protein
MLLIVGNSSVSRPFASLDEWRLWYVLHWQPGHWLALAHTDTDMHSHTLADEQQKIGLWEMPNLQARRRSHVRWQKSRAIRRSTRLACLACLACEMFNPTPSIPHTATLLVLFLHPASCVLHTAWPPYPSTQYCCLRMPHADTPPRMKPRAPTRLVAVGVNHPLLASNWTQPQVPGADDCVCLACSLVQC